MPAASTATTESVYAVFGGSASFPLEFPTAVKVKVLPSAFGTAVMMYLTGFDPMMGGMMAMLVALVEDVTMEIVGIRGFVIAGLQINANESCQGAAGRQTAD